MKTVVEFRMFMKSVEGRLTESETADLITSLATDSEQGDVIRGAGGARKLRWSSLGSSKRDGARVILFSHCTECPVFLLAIYVKAEKSNLSQTEVKFLYTACKDLSDAHGKVYFVPKGYRRHLPR